MFRLSLRCRTKKINQKQEIKKEQMDEMQNKFVVFVGGASYGVDKFEKFVKNKFRFQVKNVNLNTSYSKGKPENFNDCENLPLYEAMEEVFAETSYFSYELLLAGEKIREFISHPNFKVLIIHNTTSEIRRLMAKISDKLENVETSRIYFDYDGNRDAEFDFTVNPNTQDFDKQIESILNNELAIV